MEQSPETITIAVEILQVSFVIKAETRPKAVTKAIQEFKEKFPKTKIPTSVLRSLAKTSVVKDTDRFNQASLDELFSKEAKASA